MNALRMEVQELLREIPDVARKPALRRGLDDRWLYATDLPQVAGERETKLFLQEIHRKGWRSEEENGWLKLDRIPRMPPKGMDNGTPGAEAACCASLLKRHRDRLDPTDCMTERMLIKAAEKGTASFELACGQIHAEWAARLRRGERLPAVDIAYFISGGNESC